MLSLGTFAGASAALHTPRSTTRRDALGLGLAAAAAPYPTPVAAADGDATPSGRLLKILAADPASPYSAQATSNDPAASTRLARALASTQKQVPSGNYPSSTTLADGQRFPLASFGLQFYDDATAERLTLMAIEAGFRNFCAQSAAKNQRGFARGVKASGVPRDDLFICGCVVSNRPPTAAAAYVETARDCAENLGAFSAGGIGTLDMLMLIPGRRDTWPEQVVRAQWRALEDFQARGGARSLAVANFSPAHLDSILLEPGRRTQPTVNQLPYCVGYHDPTGVVAANARRGVHVQAWSPLGQGRLTRFLGDAPEVKQACAAVGAKYGKSAYQVGLRWITQSGASFTVSSASAAHFADDLALFDWQLDEGDMACLGALNKQTDTRI